MNELRLPVLFLTTLFCFLFLNAGQELNGQCCPYLGTVEISPQNPTATDSVYLVTEITTPGQGLYLGTETTFDQNNQIEVRSCYVDGLAASPLQFSNTINLGVFAAGNYDLNFNAISSASSFSCMPIDSNSVDLNFTVLPVAAQNCPVVISSPTDDSLCEYDVMMYSVVLDDPSLGEVFWTYPNGITFSDSLINGELYVSSSIAHYFSDSGFGICSEDYPFGFEVICSDGSVVDSGSFVVTIHANPNSSNVYTVSSGCEVSVVLECPEFVLSNPEGASYTANPGETGSIDFIVENPDAPQCSSNFPQVPSGSYHCPAIPCAAPNDYQLNLVDVLCEPLEGLVTLTWNLVTDLNDPSIPYIANGTGFNNFPVFEGTPLVITYGDSTVIPYITVSDGNGCGASWSANEIVSCDFTFIQCGGDAPGDACTDPFGNNGLLNFHCECDPTFVLPLLPGEVLLWDRVSGKVALEGFLQNDGTMSTYLADNGLLPMSQPYSGPPFNYAGTETLSSIPPNTVDWILLEFKLSNFNFTMPALVDKFGTITDLNGSSNIVPPFLGVGGMYSMTIRHRSHLDVTHSQFVSTGGNVLPFDNYRNFTYSAESVMGTDQTKPLHGKYVMRAGDYDGSHTINFLDFLQWFALNNTLNIYDAVDADGNGTVNILDFLLWFDNNNVLGYESN